MADSRVTRAMTEILILSFDMAPSAPGTPRTHGTFEERSLDHMVPLRHRNNLSAAAKELGISVSPILLARADEVID
jgi:hypothetical protein